MNVVERRVRGDHTVEWCGNPGYRAKAPVSLAKKYTRDIIAQTSAYYIWENTANDKVTAFPDGFKMIAGLKGNSGGYFPNAVAECVDASNCRRDDCST